MIKRILLVLAVIFCSINMKAQEDAFLKDTEKLVEIISENAFQPFVAQFTAMIPADKQEAFKVELISSFPELYHSMALIYVETFTHNEIKELLTFYATPVGLKLASKSGELTQKGMVAGQAWGVKVQEIMAKYK